VAAAARGSAAPGNAARQRCVRVESAPSMESPPSSRAHRRTILFVDLVSSTELYEDLGDVNARARMAPCLEELGRLIETHGGSVVKSLGDGILAAFGSERAAVDAALAMLARAPHHRLRVRVGVHAGEVLVEKGDVFGQAVNTASRLLEKARPSEILVTSDVVGRLPATLQRSARRLHDMAIKGLREPLELFVLGNEDPSATLTITDTFDLKTILPTFGLEVRLGERTWSVGPLSGLNLGRDASNDLVVEGERVSRRHATIKNRRGKYVLIDQSVNGTWLVSDDGTCVQLLREEAPLHGTGRIHLGLPPEHPLALPISFRTLG